MKNLMHKLRQIGANVGRKAITGGALALATGSVMAQTTGGYAQAAADALDGSHTDINLVLTAVMSAVILIVVFSLIKSAAKK